MGHPVDQISSHVVGGCFFIFMACRFSVTLPDLAETFSAVPAIVRGPVLIGKTILHAALVALWICLWIYRYIWWSYVVARVLAVGHGRYNTSDGLFERYNIFILGMIYGRHRVHCVLEQGETFGVGIDLLNV